MAEEFALQQFAAHGPAVHGEKWSTSSPAEVVEKILFQYDIFTHDRFLVQFTVGSMPHDTIMRSIELLGTEVAPAVREAVAGKGSRS